MQHLANNNFAFNVVQNAVKEFAAIFITSDTSTKKTIANILTSVDAEVSNHFQCDPPPPGTVEVENSILTRELKSLKDENLALKAHVAQQIQDLKRDNEDLKHNLQESHANTNLVDQLKSEIVDLKIKLATYTANETTIQSATSVLDDTEQKAKHFNAIPKDLEDFYSQMKEGDDHVPKFTELECYRLNKKTKGAYSKRKAIFNFINLYSGGVQEFIRAHKHLSTLQIYEKSVKRTRTNNAQ